MAMQRERNSKLTERKTLGLLTMVVNFNYFPIKLSAAYTLCNINVQ